MSAPVSLLSSFRRLACPLAGLALAAAAAGFAPPLEAAPKLQVVVAGTSFRNTIGEEHWLSFQRRAVAAGGGDIDIKMLIHGELGSEENIVSGLRRGRVQYANLSALIASTIVPELSVLYMPYLFESRDEADYVLDNYLTREYSKLLGAARARADRALRPRLPADLEPQDADPRTG